MTEEILIPNTRDKLVMNEPFESACLRSIQVRATADNPSGGGSGCGNIKGYLDSYGTMTTTGSFEESIDFLLTSGFLADGHGAAFGYHYPTKAEIGIFTAVAEDKEGLQLEWEYHDDPHSQTVRQKTEKRLKNNKTCGMSIGFYVGDGKNPPEGWVYSDKETQPDNIDYICVTPQFYDEVIPMYSALEYGKENLERAQQFYAVYILLRVHVFEVSQTEIPANEVSLIAEVRHKLNKPMAQLTEQELRAKKDAKRDSMKESMDSMKRAFKKAKDAHDDCKEAHEDAGEKLDAHGKSLSELSKRIKEMDSHMDDDDDDEKKEDGKRAGVGRAAFTK